MPIAKSGNCIKISTRKDQRGEMGFESNLAVFYFLQYNGSTNLRGLYQLARNDWKNILTEKIEHVGTEF